MTAQRPRKLRSYSRQEGSTLTGLIIGLIIGLGIAVAVALTITKGASPFTDRTAKAGRPADPAPGQAQDPNKPMYANRDAVREANKEVTEKAAARTAKPAEDADPLGQAIAGMSGAGEAKPAAPAAPAVAAPAARDSHPLATSVAAVPAAPAASPAAPAAAAAGAGEYVYYLQAGAFRDMSDAEATRAKLALLGFEAAISDYTSDSGVLHRVRMGPYNQVGTVNKARAKLLDNGVDVALVRTQR